MKSMRPKRPMPIAYSKKRAVTERRSVAALRSLGRHFSRAKTSQDFSARENRMMTRKRTPAYWRMSRTMTQSALIFTWGPCKGRKTLRGKEDAPQRGGLPEAKRRVSTTGAGTASDAKACVSLLSEGNIVRNKINIPRPGDVYLHNRKSWGFEKPNTNKCFT